MLPVPIKPTTDFFGLLTSIERAAPDTPIIIAVRGREIQQAKILQVLPDAVVYRPLNRNRRTLVAPLSSIDYVEVPDA